MNEIQMVTTFDYQNDKNYNVYTYLYNFQWT